MNLIIIQASYLFIYYYKLKGAIETKQAFLGNKIVSEATGEKVAVISVPIYQ